MKDSAPRGADPRFGAAAYGGDGFSRRSASHKEELGTLWAACGLDSEWAPLQAVLLHRPGPELAAAAGDPNAAHMLAPLDLELARAEHEALAQAYRDHGVTVHSLDPRGPVTPNQMFCADLFVMTPEGAILARPASTVRAGEERAVARRLADLGVPILKTLTGRATFEGADLMWLDPATVIIGRGLRTNQVAIDQIAGLLGEIGAAALAADLPYGTMHLMGMLRIVDRDLAIAWPHRTPHAAVAALRERGCEVAFLPEAEEAERNRALNFVTLGPRKILMVAGNPATQAFYESLGIDCITSPAGELAKAAGAIGCLTGVLSRERSAADDTAANPA
jgi:N-dimethylarginine dimethylaminohydrolase